MKEQIIRIPYKYSELIDTMSNEDCGKLMKGLFKKEDSGLEGLVLTYYNIIMVDIDNIENQVLKGREGGKKGGRPKIKNPPLKNKKPPLKNKKTQNKVKEDNINKDNINNISIDMEQSSIDETKNISISKKKITKKEKEKNVPQKKEKQIFGNKEINDMLENLHLVVGIDQFKESQKWQRIYGRHFVNLFNKIKKEEFVKRVTGIMNDDFKKKNCNSIIYFYKEVKAFIHTEPKKEKQNENYIKL